MLFFVASALLASAEPAAQAPVQTPPAAPAVKPKKICRVEEAVTGSITPKRVCVTVPQAAPAPAQDAARDKQQQTSSAASGNNS